MKKHSRSFLKKNLISIFTISIFAIIGGVTSSLFFAPTAVKNIATSEEKMSIYKDTSYDFILNNLNDIQIESLQASTSVNSYATFYKAAGIMKDPNGQEIDISIVNTIDEKLITLTEYTDARILKKNDVESNGVYVTERFASTHSIPLGYNFTLGGIQFTISRIYRNTYDTSIIYIPGFSNKLEEKFEQKLKPNGLYIKSNNDETLKEALKTLGVTSVQEKNINYAKDEAEAKALVDSAKQNLTFMGVLAGGIYLLGTAFYLLFTLKMTKKELVDTGRGEAIARTNITHCIGAVLAIINLIVALLLIANANGPYVQFSTVMSNSIIGLVLLVVFAAVSYLSNFLFIRFLKSGKPTAQKHKEDEGDNKEDEGDNKNKQK